MKSSLSLEVGVLYGRDVKSVVKMVAETSEMLNV
jgi:hypothetical protein